MISDALSATGKMARRYLDPRYIAFTPPHTIPSSAISSERAIFALAKIDHDGYYRVPDNYVTLIQRFNPGFIVLSYAIAVVGSLCTLELLIRRTTNAGWRNQVLLASAGFTFGSVSTFAMHFIFNNSLSLHHPLQDRKNYPALRLAYNPGFTVLSLIVSCLAMTVAFFIMGTSLQDWWCLPGSGRRRRGSSFSDSPKSGTDEYGKWKESQKSVLRRGTVGVGALLNRAGSVAKWSFMDMGGDENHHNAKWASALSKGGKWDGELDEAKTDQIVKHDKKLQELDFRLGRTAVKEEITRRVEPHTQPSSAIHPLGPGRNSTASIQPMSIPPVSSQPVEVFYPPTRRGSVPVMDHANGSEVFAPGFNFPPRNDDPTSSTANLIPVSRSSLDRTLNPAWSEADTPPTFGVDHNKRRASLPAAALTFNRDIPLRQTNTLTRIQSMPEGDVELGPSSRQGSYDKTLQDVKTFSSSDTVDASRDVSPNGKRVEFRDRHSFTKLEKFLGFDVVTRDEIIKIIITGTIAGSGVAGMRKFFQTS